MIDRETVADWIGSYLTAWDSNDPAAVRALFSPDGEYRFHPWDEPERGHDAITAAWLESQDAPGDHRFSWETVAIDGETAVVEGRTEYLAGDAAGRTYVNLWLIRFAGDGTARSFTEWYMQLPETD